MVEAQSGRTAMVKAARRPARKAARKKTVRAAAPVPTVRDTAGRRIRQPDGRKGILVRARPEAWKALKQMALDDERTLQDVMTEAINDMLKKRGMPPLA
jgi:hypothetical protein